MSHDDDNDDEHPLTAGLRAAIRRGWRGVAVAGDGAEGRVRLVCAAPAGEVDRLAARGLAIGLPPRRSPGRPDRPRRVVLAMVGDPSLALTLDLGFADARALVERIGAHEALELVWARAGDGAPLRADHVGLTAATAARLRAEAALLGEWHTRDPSPPGFGPAAWGAESRRGGRARLTRGDRPDARVVIVAPASAGPWSDGDEDIRLAFPGGPPIPEAGDGIGLRLDGPRQRALAGRLALQDAVQVLLLDEARRWVAQVDLALGDDGRALVAEAARRAGRRAATGR